jgi:hypothetical protein
MLLIRSANEGIDGETEYVSELTKLGSIVVDVCLWVLAGLLSLIRYLLAVFIGPRIEKYMVSRKAPVARECIGSDDFRRKPNMRVGVHVWESGGDVSVRHAATIP